MSNPIIQNLVLDDKSNIPFQKLDLALIDHIKNENSKTGLAEYSKRNLRTIGEQSIPFWVLRKEL